MSPEHHYVLKILNFGTFKIETRPSGFCVFMPVSPPKKSRRLAVRPSRGCNGAAVALQRQPRWRTTACLLRCREGLTASVFGRKTALKTAHLPRNRGYPADRQHVTVARSKLENLKTKTPRSEILEFCDRFVRFFPNFATSAPFSRHFPRVLPPVRASRLTVCPFDNSRNTAATAGHFPNDPFTDSRDAERDTRTQRPDFKHIILNKHPSDFCRFLDNPSL